MFDMKMLVVEYEIHLSDLWYSDNDNMFYIYMEYFEKKALGPELPVSFTINTWLRYVDDVLTIVKKGTHDSLLNYINSIDPNIKFTIEPPNEQGAIPFLDTFPRPSGNKIITSV